LDALFCDGLDETTKNELIQGFQEARGKNALDTFFDEHAKRILLNALTRVLAGNARVPDLGHFDKFRKANEFNEDKLKTALNDFTKRESDIINKIKKLFEKTKWIIGKEEMTIFKALESVGAINKKEATLLNVVFSGLSNSMSEFNKLLVKLK